jgi:capsular polysaccharide biosynthesis protein/Mrp family chromosome partitioning ATPase
LSAVSGGQPVSRDESVDVRRYIDAIRRSSRLILAIVLLVSGVVLVVSLLLPSTYQASTQLVFDPSAAGIDTDAESTQRQLATTNALVTSPRVLRRAARVIPGETESSLEDKVTSEVDPDASQANIIEVTGSDEDAEQAARIANGVSETFVAERTELERDRIANARARLQEEIDRLESSPSPAATAEIAAIRERLSQLTVSEGSAGSDLQLAGRADVPGSPTSPRPLRNVILALFGSLLLGVLIALGRDQLSPRIADPRELGRLLGVRVLAGIPYVRGTKLQRRQRLLSGAEAEAYETLRTSFQLAVPPESRSVVLVTGAVHGEGKTTVSSRLGKSLSRAGHRVLLVSADLRVPRLHELFSLDLGVGLSDLLQEAQWENPRLDALIGQATHVIVEGGDGQHGSLHVITSGSSHKDPGQLIAGPGLPATIDALQRLDYDYILLDAPPLLGIADAIVLARQADHTLLVNRLDRLTVYRAADLRELIDTMERPPLGTVVIGARSEVSPYYLGRRPALIREPEA